MAKLTAKQQRFVEEYLVDLNATQAAIRAGYSPHSAREIGCETLAKPYIQEFIGKAIAERSKRTGVNQDRVINELAKIAFANMKDFAVWDEKGVKFKSNDELTEEDTSCVSEITEVEVETDYGTKRTKKIKLYDKISALEKLGKHLGMFKDNLNITGDVPVKIVDDIE